MFWNKTKNKEVINTETVTVEVEGEVNNNYPKEVQEIHREFHTASDRLAKQANSTIEEAKTKDIDKVKRLEALGFKQANQVIETKPLIEKAKLSEETIKLISTYSVKYPNNKFITEEQVKQICFKYNLVCGDVSRFKGFVPEKNLKDIENFKLNREDIVISGVCWNSASNRTRFTISYNEYVKSIPILKGNKKHVDITENAGDERWYDSNELSKVIDREVPHKYFDRVCKEGLQICAPIKDMDISGLELRNGYKLEKKFVPDPVVLQPVNGGYLIVTAWGDEVSDPLVVNQAMN